MKLFFSFNKYPNIENIKVIFFSLMREFKYKQTQISHITTNR